MSFFPKRKSDDPPRFPAWILVLIAIGLIIIVEVVFQATSRSPETPAVMSAGPTFTPDPFDITATYVIAQATAIAQGTPQRDTASSRDDDLDPLEMTATMLIKWATEQVSTPNS